MARAYDDDLRTRVLDAAAAGASARSVAARFGVGVSTAIVWIRRARETGERTARRQGRSRGSRLDAHETFIVAMIEADNRLLFTGSSTLVSEPDYACFWAKFDLIEVRSRLHATCCRGITFHIGKL